MSTRRTAWLIGLVVAAGLIGSLGRDAASREVSIPVALLALGLCALIAEASSFRSIARGRVRPSALEGARPADGLVEVIATPGVEGMVNAIAPRFRRFSRLAEGLRQQGPSPVLDPSNPRLLGEVALISVFVGRDGRAWSEAEIARGLEGLERVGLWIEREASSREVPVNIGLAETYFRVEDDSIDEVEVAFSPEGDEIGPMEAEASTKAVAGASRAAALLGFRDVVELVGRINPLVQADARVWLFHLRRAGRSIAIPASECDVKGVGLAICYAREASFPEPLVGAGRLDPTTVAHELLHLFGANDKYGVSLGSYPTGSVTPRDIMRLDHDSLYRMRIDPLTAFEIGWGDGRDRVAKVG